MHLSSVVRVLRNIWFKITQKHQIWHKRSLCHTLSISDGRRDGRPLEAVNHDAVNQQILMAVKFGVSQNEVIWRLLNLLSPVYAVCD